MGEHNPIMEKSRPEKCRLSNYNCEQCCGKSNCPKHQTTERLRNDIIHLNSQLETNNETMQNQQGRIEAYVDEHSQLKDRIFKLEEFVGPKRMKEFNKKGKKKVEGEPEETETASTIEGEVAPTTPVDDAPSGPLAEIKCPQCGGFWHDVENNVGREELCKKCKDKLPVNIEEMNPSDGGTEFVHTGENPTDNRINDTREYDAGRTAEEDKTLENK